jgi:hypothetical protein
MDKNKKVGSRLHWSLSQNGLFWKCTRRLLFFLVSRSARKVLSTRQIERSLSFALLSGNRGIAETSMPSIIVGAFTIFLAPTSSPVTANVGITLGINRSPAGTRSVTCAGLAKQRKSHRVVDIQFCISTRPPDCPSCCSKSRNSCG